MKKSSRHELKARSMTNLENRRKKLTKESLSRLKAQTKRNVFIISGLEEEDLDVPLSQYDLDASLTYLYSQTEGNDKTGFIVNRRGYELLNKINKHVEDDLFEATAYNSLSLIEDFVKVLGFYPAPGVRWDHLIMSIHMKYGRQTMDVVHNKGASYSIKIDAYLSFLLAWFAPRQGDPQYKDSLINYLSAGFTWGVPGPKDKALDIERNRV